jgi:hypothetical protein
LGANLLFWFRRRHCTSSSEGALRRDRPPFVACCTFDLAPPL